MSPEWEAFWHGFASGFMAGAGLVLFVLWLIRRSEERWAESVRDARRQRLRHKK